MSDCHLFCLLLKNIMKTHDSMCLLYCSTIHIEIVLFFQLRLSEESSEWGEDVL